MPGGLTLGFAKGATEGRGRQVTSCVMDYALCVRHIMHSLQRILAHITHHALLPMALLNHLREDRDRNFGRRAAAEIEADRRMDARGELCKPVLA